MATSGSTNFTETRDQIILDALALLGVYGVGRTVSSEDMSFCVSMLNKMVKSWANQGLRLFTKTEAVLYLSPNQEHYKLNSDSASAYCTNKSDEVVAQLNGSVATSTSNLIVDSTAGMTVGDNIGVVLTDNTVYWTTIATILTSTTLTLTGALTGPANDNALIYTFTDRIDKPLRITAARSVLGFDNGATSTETQIPLTGIGYEDYFDLPSKSISGGMPVQYMYNPQTTYGDMYLWPRPTDGNYRIEFSYERIVEDLNNASDDFDFPPEWLEPITYQLAVRVGPAFGKDQKVIKVLMPMASTMLENLKDWDCEITSVFIGPDLGY